MSEPAHFGPDGGRNFAQVPAAHAALARRLRAAEDRLFPLVMVDADRYQRAVQLVGLLARRLTETCASLDELAEVQAQVRVWLDVTAEVEGVSPAGLDTDLVVEAAMSQRFRTLLGEQAAELQRQTVERARAAGLAWAVLEEPDPAAWRAGSARWIEAHVATGALMVRSVVADPATGQPTYHLEVFGGTGAGRTRGIRVEEFADRDTWLAAVEEARDISESES